MRHLALLCAVVLAACQADETISGYADPLAEYVLQEIDGAPFTASATIRFPEPGQISGNAPCNLYSGTQTAPYPWFAPGPLLATKRACADLNAEVAFFDALSQMTLAEVSGGTLILSNDAGREMLFQVR